MDKKTKKEYLQKLNADKFFNHALGMCTDAEEKRKIKAFAEDVFLKLIEGTTITQKIIQENPEKLEAVAEGRISRDKEPVIIKDK